MLQLTAPQNQDGAVRGKKLRYYKKVKLTAAAQCIHYHALASILYQPGVLCISLSRVKEFENEGWLVYKHSVSSPKLVLFLQSIFEEDIVHQNMLMRCYGR